MPTEAVNTTNNPVLAIILYCMGLIIGIGSLGLEEIDLITAIALRFISAVAFIGGFIASWKKIITQIKEWLNLT